MTTTFDDYNAAIHAFWTGRDLQTQKQVDSGKIDAGTRGSVTGGQHVKHPTSRCDCEPVRAPS